MQMAAPEANQDIRLARILQSDLADLETRLMASPYEIGAELPVNSTCFCLEQLRLEAGSGPISKQMCEELRNNHFIIMRLDDSGRSDVQGVWSAAQRFFDLPAEQKETVAG